MSKTTNNKKPGAKKIICVIAAIVAAAAVIFLAAFNMVLDNGAMDRSMTAIESENYSVSIADMEYFYRSVANNYISMLNSYGMSSYISIDSSTSHKLQDCSLGDGTWFDFFLSMTKTEVEKLLTCAEAARAEGITLDDEDYAAIDDEIESIIGSAESYGYSFKEYLSAVYGNSVNEKVIRECLELQLLYSAYIEAHVDAADTSDAALEELYDAEASDIVEYLQFTFDYNDFIADEEDEDEETADTAESTDTEETTDERTAFTTTDVDEAKKKAEDDANALFEDIAAASTLEERRAIFDDFIKTYLTETFGLSDEDYEENKDNFLTTSTYKEDDEMLEWMFGDDTVAGEYKLIAEDETADDDDETAELGKTYTVVLLTETAHRDVSLATADIRHILFSDDDYEDDTKANEVLAELRAVLDSGDQDKFEEEFARLAAEYSADTSNKNDGGLMEDLSKGSTVDEFDEWVFGGEHTVGDLDIVKTEDYGWHIVYFEAEGLPAWKNTLISSIEADAESAAETAAKEAYSTTSDDSKMSKWIDA